MTGFVSRTEEYDVISVWTLDGKNYRPIDKTQDVSKFVEMTQCNMDEMVGQTECIPGRHGDSVHRGDETNNHGTSAFPIFKMPKRQKYILTLCCVAYFMVRLAFSILGPFYPTEAAKKGMSTTLVGVVFGAFPLIIAVSSPILATYLSQLGSRRMIIVGVALGGLCNIVFGTLDYVPYGAPFIVSNIACRAVEALGFSSFVTSTYAVISSEFSTNMGVAIGILVGVGSLGFVVGPPLGGVLFQVGGFGLPFYFMGGLALVYGVFMYKFLPVTENVKATHHKRSVFELFRSPMVVLPMSSIVISSMGITNLLATLAEYIQEPFDLSPAVVGVVFIIPPLSFSLSSTFWGYLTDKRNLQAPILSLGLTIFTVGFLLIGPQVLVPFVPLKLWIVCVGLFLIGAGGSSFYTPTMKCMVQGAMELSFEDNEDTYSLVSGLFTSANNVGGMIGPICLGALVDAFGHQVAYTSLAMLSLFLAVVLCIFFSVRQTTVCTSGKYDLSASLGNSNKAFAADSVVSAQYWPHGRNGELE